MERKGLLAACLTIALGAAALVGESMLPDQVFLPLTPDDFPAWQAGREPQDLLRHPAPNWTMSDTLHLLLPGLSVTRQALDRGELPLWDPSQAMGVPHLDQVHYSVLYPPAWLPLVLGLDGLALMALLHLLVAGMGALAFLRAVGRSWPAATLGALGFAFSAWITARLHSFPAVGAAVWLPWVLWGLERGAMGGGWRPRVLAAGAVALSFLAGFPQVAAWGLVLAATLEVARAVSAARRVQPAVRPLLAGAGTLLLGLVLAAPQLLPTGHYAATESLRGEQTLAAVQAEGLELPLLWHLITPERYASVRVPGAHPVALMDLEQAQRPAAANRAEVSMGVGLVALLLAFVAMVFGRNWRTMTLTAVTLGVFTVLLWPAAMREFYGLMPLVRYGSPKRLLVLSSFCLAMLAAGGLDILRTRGIGVTVTGWFAAIASAALALQAHVSLPTSAFETVDAWATALAGQSGLEGLTATDVFALVPREHFGLAAAAASRSSITALVLGFLSIVLLRPRREHTQDGWTTHLRGLPWLPVLLVGVELLWSAWPLLRAAPLRGVSNEPTRVDRLRVPEMAKELRALRPEPGPGEDGQPVVAPPVRLGRVGNEPPWLRPNYPVLFGLQDVQCYAPMVPRRISELLDAVQPGLTLSGSALGGFRDGEALQSPVVDLLGVEGVLTDQPDLLPDGFSERSQVGAVRVLANEQALPRALYVPRVEIRAEPAERLALLTDAGFDPRALVVLESDPYPTQVAWREWRAVDEARATAGLPIVQEGGPAPPWATAPAGSRREVVFEAYAPGRMRLRVGPGPIGVLLVSETYHPGWRALVGSDAVPVWPADHALLALPLETTGETLVGLDFDPPLVQGGLLIGAGGWLLALGLLLLPRPRRKAVRA